MQVSYNFQMKQGATYIYPHIHGTCHYQRHCLKGRKWRPRFPLTFLWNIDDRGSTVGLHEVRA